ncbi:RcnB family protein [Stakelama sp. CBK3Z-3]|uniref:RcnB family protein n=1 Tax=Stakelama flava TaxID=2860338 RepID=A0ABS6XMQ4_9SPHN|nr:RcnB family protein [Stakelama flava]MBW4331465.1 RcnB family protein [Stakelama flava]
MRMIATTAIALATLPFAAAAPVSAQTSGGAYRNTPPPLPHQNVPAGMHHAQPRWHDDGHGRWEGGTRAPGGWQAYRQPARGWRLPDYWQAPRFHVRDYGFWGLTTPPRGYHWIRYYDDALLVDSYGQIADWMRNIDWDRVAGEGYGYSDAYAPDDYAEPYLYSEAPVQPACPGSGYGTSGGCGAVQAVTVQPSCGCVQGGYSYSQGVMWVPTTVVTVTPAVMTTTTTTTTTTEEWVEEVAAPQPVVQYAAPGKKLLRRPVRGKRLLRK